MNERILIIGQAPPNQPQDVPYSTTMLYEWFKECGISKEQAQEMFTFEAVYNKFPGYKNIGGVEGYGGHAVPTRKQMDEYWPTLEAIIEEHDKIIVLGSVARNYLDNKTVFIFTEKVLWLMHPSTFNRNRYTVNKVNLINQLKSFIFS